MAVWLNVWLWCKHESEWDGSDLARIIRETSSGGVLAEGFGGDKALAAGSDGGICITGEIERLW
jgi:hypothetical protein